MPIERWDPSAPTNAVLEDQAEDRVQRRRPRNGASFCGYPAASRKQSK